VPERPFTEEFMQNIYFRTIWYIVLKITASSPAQFSLRGAGYWLSDGCEYCDTAVFFIFQNQTRIAGHPNILEITLESRVVREKTPSTPLTL
jgi:hypothetical protein